jgi:hypothetical protein
MIRAGLVRYPLVVMPTAIWLWAGFVAAVVVGAWTLVLDPGGGQLDSALASVLLLQMFAVSNGFAGAAGRGHFDAVLVSGRPRVAIGVGVALAAATPGASAWAALLMVALAVGEPLSAVAAPHRQAAFLIVSGVGWAAGVAVPRLVAGALWFLIILGLLMSRTLFTQHLAAIQQVPASLQGFAVSVAACVICPFVLLGDFPGANDLRVVAAAMGLAIVAVAAAIAHISRRDYALTEIE